MSTRTLVVRAITLFVRLQRPGDQRDLLAQARERLYRLRAVLQNAGFEVQTLRVAFDGFAHWADTPSGLLEEVGAVLEALGPDVYVSLGRVGPDQEEAARRLPEVMARFRVYASAVLVEPGQTRVVGRHVWQAARLMHALAQVGPLGEGNTRFAATAWVPPYTPFFPAAYADPEGPPLGPWALALETGGLLVATLTPGARPQDWARALVHRLEDEAGAMADALARHEPELWAQFRGFDFSWAPYPSEERSVGTALVRLAGRPLGGHSTLAAAAWLTEALRRVRMPRTGFCGLMLPVLEDPVLARAVAEGGLDTRTLLLFSAVCGVGLDTLPLPGDTTPGQLAALLWDLAALAVKLRKPLAARVMPVPGYGPGEWVRWDNPFFTPTPVLALPAAGEHPWDESAVLDLGPDHEEGEPPAS